MSVVLWVCLASLCSLGDHQATDWLIWIVGQWGFCMSVYSFMLWPSNNIVIIQHLGFLYPLKRIQSDLMVKLKQDSSAASIYKWIKVRENNLIVLPRLLGTWYLCREAVGLILIEVLGWSIDILIILQPVSHLHNTCIISYNIIAVIISCQQVLTHVTSSVLDCKLFKNVMFSTVCILCPDMDCRICSQNL